MLLIGLKGRYGAGKDTLAAHVAAALPGVQIKRAAFADKLKMSAAVALGFVPQNVEEAVRMMDDLKSGDVFVRMPVGQPSLQKFPDGTLGMAVPMHTHTVSGRKYLQIYGTEAHRDVFGLDFWVDALLPMGGPWFSQLFPDTDVLFVTDTRFPNEAVRVRDLGGHVWAVGAEGRLGPLPEDAHASECHLSVDMVDRVWDNNGTPEEFEALCKGPVADAVRDLL